MVFHLSAQNKADDDTMGPRSQPTPTRITHPVFVLFVDTALDECKN